jgi:hypothetical protein
MEQRPLRLGDIVDDYCPRERRITNHAIVALVGENIRTTRCTTCDGEHVYKQGRVPKRITVSKDAADAALADNGQGQLVPKAAASAKDESEPAAAEPPASERPAENGSPEPPREPESWFSHRPLIRASLPRTEGEPPAPRPIPEFTMHRQAYGRNFRQGQGHGRFGQNGQSSNGIDPDRQPNGNHANYGNGNHGNAGNQPRPAGSGRRRRRRGGRHKHSQH